MRDVERAARDAGREEADAARAAQAAHAAMLERQMGAEKEARVAHIGLMAARRLGQQGVLRAWESWVHEYRTQQRQVRTHPHPEPNPGPCPNPRPSPGPNPAPAPDPNPKPDPAPAVAPAVAPDPNSNLLLGSHARGSGGAADAACAGGGDGALEGRVASRGEAEIAPRSRRAPPRQIGARGDALRRPCGTVPVGPSVRLVRPEFGSFRYR